MRDQIAAQLAPLQERFDALEPRERIAVVVCGVFLLCALLYVALWKPLTDGRANLQRQLADERALAARLQTAASQVQTLRRAGGGNAQSSNRSVMALVDQTGRSAGLGGQLSVQPDGTGKARARMDGVGFDATLRWINQLESNYGLTVESASISGKSTPGQVEARLTFEREGAS